MARLATPKGATECSCGIVIRENDMIRDSFHNAEYLLCPLCKIAHFVFTPNTDDETQKPVITKERMEWDSSAQILYKIRLSRRKTSG